MKKILITCFSILLFLGIGLSSSAYANKDQIAPKEKIEVNGNVEKGQQALGLPGAVKAAGKAAKNAWNNIGSPEKHMVTEAAQNAVGLGKVEKNSDEINEDSEYMFDK
ncbi:hypothetical protein BUZ33_10695 [Staphylococcus haemolyticus]|uniref:hypothetical protein n=1 Tax=Staphylococcus haemolyticus TaxID=1283 RepID=UPI000D1E5B27|nr:hypothetical protein [Staphylococcus haemolyticus]PTK54581.1 hypothetical protein BUZ33_10695 [Staphylococcus haemolyticus]